MLLFVCTASPVSRQGSSVKDAAVENLKSFGIPAFTRFAEFIDSLSDEEYLELASRPEVQEAVELIESGDYLEAIALLRKAWADVPEFGPVADEMERLVTGETSSNSNGCVEHDWLVSSGYDVHTEMVHEQPVDALVHCLRDYPSLPCGTEHHAVAVDDSAVTSYGQYCASNQGACYTRYAKVNSLWSFHSVAKHGIRTDDNAVLFMHDVRYPVFAQRALHRAMAAARWVQASAVGAALQSTLEKTSLRTEL